MPYEGAKDGKHYWLTPPKLYEELDAEFHFDFDPAPYPRPDDFDGTEAEWGQSNYVNPPFKGPAKWVRKAIAEYEKGKKVVFVFPLDKWVHYLIQAGAEIRTLGDVRWHSIEENEPGKGTGRWIAAFVLDPERETKGSLFTKLVDVAKAARFAKYMAASSFDDALNKELDVLRDTLEEIPDSIFEDD